MAKLDPRLRFLMRAGGSISARTAARFGVTAPKAARKGRRGKGAAKNAVKTRAVEVLVRMAPGAKRRDLEAAGMRVTTIIPGPHAIASGEIPVSKLSKLKDSGAVRHVEAARHLMPELDRCVPEVRADKLHAEPRPICGKGAFIGIVDAGIDYRHPDFRLPDGNTRIRCLWDQRAAVKGGDVPFGREYTSKQINAALRGKAAARDIPSTGPDPVGRAHGTHVAGIAAGGGRASPDHVGLAPEADLIVVMFDNIHAPTIGRSTKALDAFVYVIDRAAGTPVAINLSRGMNGGGHSGETLLETALEYFARLPDVAIIKSAGNEGNQHTHAGGMLAPNRTKEIQFEVPKEDRNDDVIEVWFNDKDDVGVAVKPPTGPATEFVRGESERHFRSAKGNGISIAVDMNSADTGDTAATIVLSRGRAKNRKIQPGVWTLLLKAGRLKFGRYDAWIERARVHLDKEQARFAKGHRQIAGTVSIPGTTRNVITVGSYVTRVSKKPASAGKGKLSRFSGKGPTRYGYMKPDLVAPGEVIEAAKAGSRDLVRNAGTSMAAPAVTGTAALIMSQKRGLRSYQLRQILIRSARRAGARAGDHGFGHGKLDALRALKLASKIRFPVVSNVRIAGTTIKWRTDIPTTGRVRFSQDPRLLQLGKNPLRTLRSPTSGSTHKIDLRGCPAGTYFCEITAFGPGRFLTEEDRGGYCYEVQVPGASGHKRRLRSKT
jgi:subtilisin family serine protease